MQNTFPIESNFISSARLCVASETIRSRRHVQTQGYLLNHITVVTNPQMQRVASQQVKNLSEKDLRKILTVKDKQPTYHCFGGLLSKDISTALLVKVVNRLLKCTKSGQK